MFLRLVIQGGDGCITSCSVEVPGEEFAVLTEWAMYYKRKKEKISKKHIIGVTTAERPHVLVNKRMSVLMQQLDTRSRD